MKDMAFIWILIFAGVAMITILALIGLVVAVMFVGWMIEMWRHRK